MVLCSLGLGLVAFAQTILWIHIGAYLTLAGVIWLLLYMVLYKEDWEKQLEKYSKE